MTDEQMVLAWLRRRGVDTFGAAWHLEGGLPAAARALAVVAAMESGCNPHRDFDAIEPDEAYVCHIYDGGESVAEGYGPTPWDALVALAKEGA